MIKTVKSRSFEFTLIIAALIYDLFVFYISRLITENSSHYIFETVIDKKIPFIPSMIYIYLGAFVFWAVNYYLSVAYGRGAAKRFIIAHFIGETVCFLFFILLPTTMARAEITGSSLAERLVGVTYGLDEQNNLLPSLHCFISWLCWIGVRGNKKIPKWYRIFSLIFALAVCISTLTVKQHVLVDFPTGVLLAELSYFVAGRAMYLRRRNKKPA